MCTCLSTRTTTKNANSYYRVKINKQNKRNEKKKKTLDIQICCAACLTNKHHTILFFQVNNYKRPQAHCLNVSITLYISLHATVQGGPKEARPILLHNF